MTSVDVVRGIVMVIMALDHVRDLIHVDSVVQPNPVDLATTTPALFFTRWITHLCAPTFVFLAGVSAFLGRDSVEDRWFLVKRGLWLILLEITVVNFALWFDLGFHLIVFQVIGAIGLAFVVLGLLRNVSPTVIGAIGVAIVVLHGLLPVPGLSAPGAFPLGPGPVFIMGYPPLPWLGVMMAGYGAGRFFERDASSRRGLFVKLGGLLIVLFVGLRLLNFYGDPVKWSSQSDAVMTFLSFMNVSKYPPSLLFCMATLGVMFLMLAAVEGWNGKIASVFENFGRVPLFYFIVHFYVIHIVLLIVLLAQGIGFGAMDFASGTFGRPKGEVTGLSLGWIYVLWLGVVAFMYPLCVVYGSFKRGRPWLRYL